MSTSQNGHPDLPGEDALSITEHPFTLSEELDLALELADVADQIVVEHFRSDGYAFVNKYDGTPVTAIDRAVERAIRERVAIRRPGYLVLGEEDGLGEGAPSPHTGAAGDAPTSAEREGMQSVSPPLAGEGSGVGSPRPRWIVDPIDGTRKFVRGIPVFATLLALERDGEIVVGLASAPLMADRGHRWWAMKGLGAYKDGRLIQVSRVDRLEDANLLHGSVEGWVRRGYARPLLDLCTGAWGTTGFGDFWIHLLVAEGLADAAAEPEAAVWDVAALKLIVEEAGGRFSDFAGRPTPYGGNALSSNGLVHDEILTRLVT
jgi:histidinol-phosphatase